MIAGIFVFHDNDGLSIFADTGRTSIDGNVAQLMQEEFAA